MNYWERKEKLFKYTEGVRQFFPLAEEQLEIISRIIEKFNPGIDSFLDLGCGDGFMGNFIYRLYPGSRGVFLDCSAEMIEKARARNTKKSSEFIVRDLGDKDWYKAIKTAGTFDLVISGYAIHHLENEQKRRLYRDIFRLLNPNGLFLNLEHVSSPTESLEELFNELFLDRMSDYQESINEIKTPGEIKKIYYDPEHKKLNKLESEDVQCAWLRDIGYSEVDCYLKIFDLAVFGGIKK